jgi:PAS domain S-box-containing protein
VRDVRAEPQPPVSMPEERPAPNARMTPYQLTVSAMIVPLRLHMALNAAIGVAFGLVSGPYVAGLWLAGLTTCDVVLQRVYRRLQADAAHVDSDPGLRRLAWIGLAKGAFWISAPTAFAVMTHSPAGLAFVAVLCILLTGLAVSTFRNSRLIFLTVAVLPIAALALCVVAVIGARAGAGVLLGIGLVMAMLVRIAAGTNRTVADWNRATQLAADAMASMTTALERSEAVERRLRIAIEIADLYVFEADYVRRIFTGAGAEPELFGQLYGGDDFWEDPFRNVFPDDLARVEAAWASYAAGEGPYKIEHRANGPDGSVLWISASAEYLRDESGRPRALIGSMRNITERKRGELVLTKALEEAETANRAKSEFLATMSHEIRTPLNGVLGMAQVMHRGELSDPQRDHLRMISTAGASLLTLLNDLLDLSKIDAGKVDLEDGVIDTEALASGLDAFALLLQDKDVVLSVAVAPEARGGWAGDPTRVRQVLHNLVSNAVKFTDRGTISAVISYDAAALVFTVEDTGAGISDARLAQVFEPFVQADASTTRRYGGSGLGLTICRDLLTLMGGTIELASTEGVGSKFTVRLPALPAACAAPVESEAPIAIVDGLRVLAAEDNPMNQVVLRTLLEASDIQVVVVSNGEEAVAAWEAGRWDLVLMDIQMPVMDGVEATRIIREAERAAGLVRTPIIALTANAMDHHRSEYLSAGMDVLVAKPINLEVLLQTMQSLLGTGDGVVPLEIETTHFATVR